MATSFPLDPEINDLYQGYYWDGNFWKKSGQDTGFGYLEESALQNTYLSQASASTTYVKKTDTELVKYGSTAPLSPEEGTIWIDSTNSIKPVTKVYNGSTWIIASGQAEATIHSFFLAGI
jgi:hypothetical protein